MSLFENIAPLTTDVTVLERAARSAASANDVNTLTAIAAAPVSSPELDAILVARRECAVRIAWLNAPSRSTADIAACVAGEKRVTVLVPVASTPGVDDQVLLSLVNQNLSPTATAKIAASVLANLSASDSTRIAAVDRLIPVVRVLSHSWIGKVRHALIAAPAVMAHVWEQLWRECMLTKSWQAANRIAVFLGEVFRYSASALEQPALMPTDPQRAFDVLTSVELAVALQSEDSCGLSRQRLRWCAQLLFDMWMPVACATGTDGTVLPDSAREELANCLVTRMSSRGRPQMLQWFAQRHGRLLEPLVSVTAVVAQLQTATDPQAVVRLVESVKVGVLIPLAAARAAWVNPYATAEVLIEIARHVPLLCTQQLLKARCDDAAVTAACVCWMTHRSAPHAGFPLFIKAALSALQDPSAAAASGLCEALKMGVSVTQLQRFALWLLSAVPAIDRHVLILNAPAALVVAPNTPTVIASVAAQALSTVDATVFDRVQVLSDSFTGTLAQLLSMSELIGCAPAA